MNDAEIEQALNRATPASQPLPAELLKGIADSLEPTLVPVRPLPPGWVLVGGLLVVAAAVALAGASRAGFGGFAALAPHARVAIFAALALVGCVAAGRMVAEWIPGSRSRLSAAGVVTLATVALLAVFGLLFHDYHTDHFVAAGIGCLSTGLLWAVPAALLGVWWLRRGWVVNHVSAGLAAGALAGLAGVTLLELQCTNFQALHILVWHVLVVPVSGAAGALLGWVLNRAIPTLGR